MLMISDSTTGEHRPCLHKLDVRYKRRGFVGTMSHVVEKKCLLINALLLANGRMYTYT